MSVAVRDDDFELMVDVPDKLIPIFQPYRFKCAYGGRGSAKSHTFGRALIVQGFENPLRILCTREIQKSIKKSVHQLLRDIIKDLGLEWFYTITSTEIVGLNGTKIFFMGLKHSIDSILSIEGLDRVWIEEAHNLSKGNWNKLVPTVRKDGSEIWVSFNPHNEGDFVYQHFIENTPPDTLLININHDDNPWFPETLQLELDHMMATDMNLARHIYGGECEKNPEAQVFGGKCVVRDFKTPAGVTFYTGLDFGFGPDPTVLTRCFIVGELLFVDIAKFWYHADIEDLPALIEGEFPDAKEWRIYGDSADPSTIQFLRKKGFNIQKGKKGAGSIKSGIRHIRGFGKVVLKDTLTNAHEEARLYKYKVDPTTEDVLPIIVDAFNHFWDSLRYALSKRISQGILRKETQNE